MSQIFGLIFLLAKFVLTFYGAIAFFDATRRPADAFEVVGRGSRTAWIVGMAVSSVIAFWFLEFLLISLIATVGIIVYHVDQKPKLNEVMRPRY